MSHFIVTDRKTDYELGYTRRHHGEPALDA